MLVKGLIWDDWNRKLKKFVMENIRLLKVIEKES